MVSSPPVPAQFVYHFTNSTDDQGNGHCDDVYGLQFAAVPKAIAYAIDYYDGYWKSPFDTTNTAAQLLAEGPYESPTELFHGITGGSGPGPCTTQPGDDGGRFSQPATVTPEFPSSYTPPLSHSSSKSSPAGAATVTIRAAKGTFPVGSTVSIEIVLKASGGALTNPEPGKLHVTGGQVSNPPSGESGAPLARHASEVFSASVTATKAGTVPLSVTFIAKNTHGKKVTAKGTSSVTFG